LQPATEVRAKGERDKEEVDLKRGRRIIYQTSGTLKSFEKRLKKVWQIKKVFYLCSPKKNGSSPADVGRTK
jgi:hypothetical protein